MALASGTRLGPYEIVSLLGAGGMGEVYKARDPRLGRDVAIKVLPASFAADPSRLQRFEQEARAVAALSHPNICTVHDVGRVEARSPEGLRHVSTAEALRHVGTAEGLRHVGTAEGLRHIGTDEGLRHIGTAEGLRHVGTDVAQGFSPADVHFLVMELLEGETLRTTVDRGPLGLKRTTDIALQLVAGLAAAHDRGIVHRDLKPENVFLTRNLVVKILDFGLAKYVPGGTGGAGLAGGAGGAGTDVAQGFSPAAVSPADAATFAPTSAGLILGTVGYMSPEQVRGHTADSRSDIFAIGTILFEMISGQRAFRGDSPADTMSAVLREPPPDLVLRSGTPPALARLVRRCLEKDPADRFQSARDLRFAIESISDIQPAGAATATKVDEKSIAVLPFANMSADADNQYFSDGLAEELINALSRLPGLKVASRTSAFRFRGGDVDIREIGRQLQVTTVLEGSVRRAGQRLRITAQLINVADGYHVWSERYDREMADVFAIQDEIVESIVKALAPALVGDAKGAVKRPTENVDAYTLYLQGRHFWHQRSPNSLQNAIRCFDQVIALDPEYALAYAALADCYAIYRVYGWYSAEKCRPPAVAAVAKAVALDSSLAEVHYSQALVTYYFDRHWRAAETHMRRALAINPRLALAHGYLGIVLCSDYRTEEALAAVGRALELDPLSPFIHYLAVAIHYVLGQFDAGERAARRVLELQPDALLGLWPLMLNLSGLGRPEEAIATGERMIKLSRAPFYVGVLGIAYAQGGRGDDARQLLSELEERQARGEYVSPTGALMIHVGLQDIESTRRALQACLDDEAPPLSIQSTAGPLLDAMRGDTEIDRLLDVLYDGARPRR